MSATAADKQHRPIGIGTVLANAGAITAFAGVWLYIAGYSFAYAYLGQGYGIGPVVAQIPDSFYLMYGFEVAERRWPWLALALVVIVVAAVLLHRRYPGAGWDAALVSVGAVLLLFWAAHIGKSVGSETHRWELTERWPWHRKVQVVLAADPDSAGTLPLDPSRLAQSGCFVLILDTPQTTFLSPLPGAPPSTSNRGVLPQPVLAVPRSRIIMMRMSESRATHCPP